MTELEVLEHRYQILLQVMYLQHVPIILGVRIASDKQASKCARIFQNILTAQKLIEEQK